MIKRLLSQVANSLSESSSGKDDAPGREAAIRKATAVLMLDVALADNVFDDREIDRVLALIASRFALPPADAADLVDLAKDTADDLVSLHEFTTVLHANLTEDEKASVVSLLWDVAYADGQLDKYENALILKISDLLYVSRVRVMRSKHDAGQAARRES